MAVYTDNARISWRGRKWCHLVADNLDELHAFARSIGLRRGWFQANASLPHYDITLETREIALTRGAKLVDRRTLVASGRRLKQELLSEQARESAQLALFD
ncbi:DUF4031 domain-containing protein [Ralstonia pseudosolanacearum]|uniref:DUF4031 domain-containing protein n=1 Tax=Ralstonia pseudosolanacearum TaxID=1310165 RepID=UPI0018D18901|nr:DUF4031 domain-containing protein [Ralstonia pseudosolanacearum]